MTRLDLTEDERRTLLRLVRDAIDASRFPLSPEVEALRALAEKLGEHEKRARILIPAYLEPGWYVPAGIWADRSVAADVGLRGASIVTARGLNTDSILSPTDHQSRPPNIGRKIARHAPVT